MTQAPLGKADIECLLALAGRRPDSTSDCVPAVLQRLTSLGLIEQTRSGWLPLETRRAGYRLTAAGWRTLEQLHGG